MGVKNSKKSKIIKINHRQENFTLSSDAFDFKCVIGKGGFGKVWKVVLKKTGENFALKQMSKAKIIDKKSERSIKYERDLLAKINHPFIVNMHFAFQDHDNLYLVMDLLTGGDLRYHLSKNKRFTEQQTKFFVCCIILGLEYLHINNILHRDIKPENLVLDKDGYLRITDFGIAKIFQSINSTETSGTPGYMSPEVIVGHNHNQVVDYFALGVLTYEFMMGTRPYTGKNRREIKEKIIATQFLITKDKVPPGWSFSAGDFINKLLQRKPANRLGLRSAKEVKEHPWIKKYRWKDLYLKKIEPKFIPPVGDNFDKKYCNQEEKMTPTMKAKYEKILEDPSYSNAFDNFVFYGKYLEEMKKVNKNNCNNIFVQNGINMIKEDFINPHENENFLSNGEGGGVDLEGVGVIEEIKEEDEKENGEIDEDIVEKKLVKNIQESNSSSNQVLMRHYKRIDNGYIIGRNEFFGNINEEIEGVGENYGRHPEIENDIIPDDGDD